MVETGVVVDHGESLMVYRQLAASQRAEEGAVVGPLRKGNASRLRHVVADLKEVARGGASSRSEAGGHYKVESSDVWSAAHLVVISQPVLVAVLAGVQTESEGESEGEKRQSCSLSPLVSPSYFNDVVPCAVSPTPTAKLI